MDTNPQTSDCNCLENYGDLLKERLEQTDGVQEVHYVLINSTFALNAGVSRALLKADYKATRELKNGKTKEMEGTLPIVASFCPFCGKEY